MQEQKPFSYSFGAGLALPGAGPTFLTLLWLGEIVVAGNSDWVGSAGSYLMILPLALLIGALLAAIPITLGGFVMGHLGTDLRQSRAYPVWAISGAVVALPMPMLLGVGANWQLLTLFATTGAVCALLVRYGTRWHDAAPAAFRETIEGEVK